jgi:regulator of sirC expression with transglutaminase-like and TPR domain
VLFQEESFRGNAEEYYDPRNSFLNDVLDRHVGIPITLAILYLETGWRLDLPLEGVNFPGHFMVRYAGEAVRLLVDPFQSGLIRFEDEAQNLLDHVYGGSVQLEPEFLRTAGRRDILVRLLSNLKGIYHNQHDDRRALSVIERILLVKPSSPDDVRDRGMALVRLGREREGAAVLREYLDLAPDADDVTRIRLVLEQLGTSP